MTRRVSTKNSPYQKNVKKRSYRLSMDLYLNTIYVLKIFHLRIIAPSEGMLPFLLDQRRLSFCSYVLGASN